jgi:WD40 repeat protein
VRQHWNLGRMVILVATGLALVSFFWNWVDNRVTTATGFGEWAFVLFALFVYPLVQALRNRPMWRLPGLACGLGAAALAGLYIFQQRIETFEHVLHVAAEGAYLFVAASLLLCVGVVVYRLASPQRRTSAMSAGQLGSWESWHWFALGAAVFVGVCCGLFVVGRNSPAVWLPGKPVEAARVLQGHHDWIYRVTFAPDGRQVLSCSYDGALRLWHVDSGEAAGSHELRAGPVMAAAFSPAGIRVLCGIDKDAFGLWDVETASEIHRLRGHEAQLYSAAFSPSHDVALSGSDDNSIRLWDLQAGWELRRFDGHYLWVNCVAFSADGRRALSGSLDKTVRLWDVNTGAELKRFRWHLKQVNSVAFSPDGRFALSSSEDATVRLWDLESGEEVRCFKGHEGSVNSAAFLPDGLRALSGGNDGTVRLWDVVNGTELKCLTGHTGWVGSVAVSADGRWAASGGEDGAVRLWMLPP